MAEFSYFVPCEFPFCEKDLGDFLLAPEALWNCGYQGEGTGFLRDTGTPTAFGAGSLRVVAASDSGMGADAASGMQAAVGTSVQLLIVVCVVHRSKKVDHELGCLPGSLHHH